MRLVSGILLLGALVSTAWCQQPAGTVTLDCNKGYDVATNWIRDSEPQRRAWAAELIARCHFDPLYPSLRGTLSDFRPNSSGNFQGTPDELALEAVAGAIIRARIPVLAEDARKLYPEFPALALILLSRPLDDSRAALLSILSESKVGEVWLAAANLLAVNPSAEFVIRQLDEFSIFTRILVSRPGAGIGMSYGDCLRSSDKSAPVAIPESWPPVSIYRLQVGANQGNVIASGINPVSFTDSITSEVRPWKGDSECGGPQIQGLRRDLIVQLAGTEPASTALSAVVLRDLVWETDDQYRRDAMAILLEQTRSFAEVLGRLQSRGLITVAQAAGRHLHMQVHIVQSTSESPLPDLPELRSLGIIGDYQQHLI